MSGKSWVLEFLDLMEVLTGFLLGSAGSENSFDYYIDDIDESLFTNRL
jgi:hypothetical protein